MDEHILTHRALQLLVTAYFNTDQEFFVKYFGEHMGEHFWRQFTTLYDHDIVRFYNYLDLENRRRWMAAVEEEWGNG